jgi:hypothetical protein
MRLKYKIGREQWVSFLLTLIATLIGVFLAIWLTESEMREKEKEDTIKLLTTAKLMLSNTRDYSKNLNNTIIGLKRDSVQYPEDDIETVKSNNPVPYPGLVETIISNELVAKNISEYSHNNLYNDLINIRKLTEYETIEYYLKSLEEMILVLDLEIELLKDQIELSELESAYNTRVEEIEQAYSTENILEVKIEE